MKHRVAFILLSVFLSIGSVLWGAPDEKPRVGSLINKSAVVTVIGYDASGNKISQGNGFIVKDTGSVAVCWHVISAASKVKIMRNGATVVSDGIIMSDTARDFAIIHMPGKRLPALQLGDSDSVKKGDSVYTIMASGKSSIGNGIVQSIIMLPRAPILLKTSVKIQPENSGSPLMDANDKVIGMNVAIKADGQIYEFAIPINTIKTGLSTGDKITPYSQSKTENYLDTAESFFVRAILSLPENPRAGDAKKRMETALDLFKKAAEKRKDYADAWFYVGYCSGELGRNEEAYNAFKQAIAIRSEFPEAHFGMGLSAVNLGWYQDAVSAFKEAIRIKPDYADAYYNLGLAYINLGWNQDAISSFKEAIRINPNYADAYYNLGVIYAQEGSNQEAVDAFKNAIRVNPDNAQAEFGLGVALINMGLNKDAIDAFKEAIRIKPDYPEAHFGLGVAYLNLEDYQNAVESFKQAIRLKPDDPDYSYNLGLAYEKLGMINEAIESYKRAIKSQPNYADARYSLGALYVSINDRGSALEEYKALKDLDPNLADRLFKLIYP